MTAPRTTALVDEHVALGADMGAYQWAQMAMPWSYRASLADEQRAVRERAGLCDTSQLQVISVRGPGALACVEQLVPRPIADLPVGTSRFSVLVNRFGRICDEALVLRTGEDELWISHGCGATRAQLAKLARGDVEVAPLEDLHVLAIQGPASAAILGPLADVELGALPFLGHRRATVGGHPALVSRSGFTGELGFEIFCAADHVIALWRLLRAAGAPHELLPYAYRCVDLLRIEAGFPLYPNDLADVSIWEAGLGWLVRGKHADHVGREAIERAKGGARHRLAGVRIAGEHAIARGANLTRDDRVIGVVTSSAFSPAAAETLCLARVERDALPGETTVLVAGTTGAGRLSALPFRARRGLDGPP